MNSPFVTLANVQFWQIASGLGVGAFVSGIFLTVAKRYGAKKGEGIQLSRLSSRDSAIVAILLLILVSTITIVALVLYAPKGESQSSSEEFKRTLLDRYTRVREIIEPKNGSDDASKKAYDMITQQLNRMEDAAKKGDMHRVHDGTKRMYDILDSKEIKFTVPENIRKEVKENVVMPPIKDELGRTLNTRTGEWEFKPVAS